MVYAAQPREGTETLPILTWDASDEYGLCSSTPRGDGNWHAIHYTIIHDGIRFMQLNPARGRKPGEYLLYQGAFQRGLCSSTPRGDGNSLSGQLYTRTVVSWFMQLNPARGRKRDVACRTPARRGFGLCGSTPRGDGNKKSHARMVTHNDMVYVAQPREGTETSPSFDPPWVVQGGGLCSSTPRGDGNSSSLSTTRAWVSPGFMQLNPARGRKQALKKIDSQPHNAHGLCILTPRGDESGLLPHSRGMEQLSIRTPTTTPLHAQALSPLPTPSTYPVFLWGAYGRI